MTATIRIAMWSGPRNLSTATMRSFGARGDTICVDEPFYAAYLSLTGLVHPMQDEIMASQPTDPQRVIEDLLAPSSDPDRPILYQKHMTHHMVRGIARDWMSEVTNAFLIRHPARVLASYAKKMETASLEAIGFPQQAELFDQVADQLGHAPVVVDSDDILKDPASTLPKLCKALGIPWTENMLSWPEGPKPEDGAWAPHWYESVNASTGFGKPPGDLPDLPDAFAPILDAAMPIYEAMSRYSI